MPAPGKGPGSASGTGGPGALGGSGKGSQGGFSGKDKSKKKDPTRTLPPGLNPAKYEANPTESFEPTASNLAQVVGTIAGALVPGGPALTAVKTAYNALTDDEFDPLNPFEKPTGTVPGSSYDKSETVKAAAGTGASQMGANPIVGKTSPEQKKKKKVEQKPGFTLLQGVGGTLLGT